MRKIRLFLPVVVIVALAGCGSDEPTAPKNGVLDVGVEGLPRSAQASVIVTGPNAFSTALVSSTALQNLANGAYTIAAADVTTPTGRYAPTPATQKITVTSAPSVAAVAYVLATARLALTVVGLPSGASAAISLTGPNASTQTVTSTSIVEQLAPGDYTITANDVVVAGKTYRSSPRTQSVSLTASATPTFVSAAYGGGTASLDLTIAGLPAATGGALHVTGPAGFDRVVTSTSTLSYLDAGSYTITADTVGSNLTTHAPSTSAAQTVVLADGGTATAAVTYGSAPLQLGVQLVVDGLSSPVFLTAPAGDSRLFVVERIGRVRIVTNGVLLPQSFLDITDRVNFTGERGMLSMAFDPEYATNGIFYVYYVDRNSDLVTERFTASPGSNVAGASAGIVITIGHGAKDHHGGLITFGPDGMLYIAPGDGGCCGDPNNNAQNVNTLLGKLLRIDVRSTPYTVPFSNPFRGTAGARPEIWAFGLRNPWRFSFDAPTGLLYIGDVGNDAREEVDVVPSAAKGINFGWRLMEGTACFNPSTGCSSGQSLTGPILDYPHSDGCSVTAGYVYRGSAIPELTGHFLYADYCRGWVRSFRFSAGSTTESRAWSGLSLPFYPSFGRDGKGELYMVGSTRAWRFVRK